MCQLQWGFHHMTITALDSTLRRERDGFATSLPASATRLAATQTKKSTPDRRVIACRRTRKPARWTRAQHTPIHMAIKARQPLSRLQLQQTAAAGRGRALHPLPQASMMGTAGAPAGMSLCCDDAHSSAPAAEAAGAPAPRNTCSPTSQMKDATTLQVSRAVYRWNRFRVSRQPGFPVDGVGQGPTMPSSLPQARFCFPVDGGRSDNAFEVCLWSAFFETLGPPLIVYIV